MHFAANNHYGSETDRGFANTWYVIAFESKAARDEYIEQSKSLAATAITRREVSAHVTRAPKPFTPERYAIIQLARDIPGAIGEVSAATPQDAGYISDLDAITS